MILLKPILSLSITFWIKSPSRLLSNPPPNLFNVVNLPGGRRPAPSSISIPLVVIERPLLKPLTNPPRPLKLPRPLNHSRLLPRLFVGADAIKSSEEERIYLIEQQSRTIQKRNKKMKRSNDDHTE